MRHYLAYGEAFGVLSFLPVAERAPMAFPAARRSPSCRRIACRAAPASSGLEDGIFHDANGRPLVYRFPPTGGRHRARHGHRRARRLRPAHGAPCLDRGATPGSVRGISPMASTFKVIAQHDQLADATLATALMQTIFAATINSPEPSETAFQAIQTLADTEPPQSWAGSAAEWSAMVGGVAADLIDVWGQRIEALKGAASTFRTARAQSAISAPARSWSFTRRHPREQLPAVHGEHEARGGPRHRCDGHLGQHDFNGGEPIPPSAWRRPPSGRSPYGGGTDPGASRAGRLRGLAGRGRLFRPRPVQGRLSRLRGEPRTGVLGGMAGAGGADRR